MTPRPWRLPPCRPDGHDMLREILLRLPPHPSSLPRASAVCKRWRGLVTDPKFLCSFRSHHRKPPLLGGFGWSVDEGIVFTPVLDPPNRVSPARFSLGSCSSCDYHVLDCRHGLVLVKEWMSEEVVVCDPVTGEQGHVAIPSELRSGVIGGAVLCAFSDLAHVHGGCHSGPFKVVLVSTYKNDNENGLLASVYSSETGIWGNLILTATSCQRLHTPTLVDNALYWLSSRGRIVEFDLDGQSLAVLDGPPVAYFFLQCNSRIIQGEDGGVGFAVLSWPRFQTWQRNVNGDGVGTWVPWKTIGMRTNLGLPYPIERIVQMLDYDEDHGVMFLSVDGSLYTVLLMSMQSRKIYGTRHIYGYYPFTSFYTPGMDIAGSRYIG